MPAKLWRTITLPICLVGIAFAGANPLFAQGIRPIPRPGRIEAENYDTPARAFLTTISRPATTAAGFPAANGWMTKPSSNYLPWSARSIAESNEASPVTS